MTQGGPGGGGGGSPQRGEASSCVTVIARPGAEEAAVPTASSTGTIWARPGPASPHGHSGLTSNNFLLPPAGGHPTHLEPARPALPRPGLGGQCPSCVVHASCPSPVLSRTFPRAHLSGAASLSLGPVAEADPGGRPDRPHPLAPWASWPPPTREGPPRAGQRLLSLCVASWLGAPGKPFPASRWAPWGESGPPVWDVLRALGIPPALRVQKPYQSPLGAFRLPVCRSPGPAGHSATGATKATC